MVGKGSSMKSLEFGSSWVSLTGLCILLCPGNLFVVQWDKVRLKDREAAGPFTFQAALHKNGTIVFNYKDVSYVFLIRCSKKYNSTTSIFCKKTQLSLNVRFTSVKTNFCSFLRSHCQWRK